MTRIPRPRQALRLLSLCLLLLLAPGCSVFGKKEGEQRWKTFTPDAVQAEIEWSAGEQKLPGNFLFQKPFKLRVTIKGQGEFLLNEQSLALGRDPWRGAIELRGAHLFRDKPLLRYLDQMLGCSRKHYDVESVPGPEISGRKTLQLTLRPKAAPKLAALASITDLVERYWIDSELSLPLRYALLDAQGAEIYGWQMSKLDLQAKPAGTQFFLFPFGDAYKLPLFLPIASTAVNISSPVSAISPEAARKDLGYPLFALGAPFQLRTVTIFSNRPLMDYSDPKRGGFAYLLQAPLADPEMAALELKAEGNTWQKPRRERFFKGQDFGPDNVGLHSLQLGPRTIGYDNFCGIKAFGWTENGHALTLLTTADFRETLVAIAAGRFP